MLRDDILEKLRSNKAALDGYGVATIAVFGSVARGEAEGDSDVDILVDFDPDRTPGLFAFIGLKHHLEDLLGRPVDLATPDALHPMLKEGILKETHYA